MTKPARFIVQATCAIPGSYMENVVAKLWYGATKAAAERVMARKQAEFGSLYRDWHVVEVA